jgi:hypothetical protein
MFGFLPHRLFTGHNGANTSGLSPRLWNRVSGGIMAADGNKRLYLVGDDFSAMTYGLSTGTAFTSALPYRLFRDDTTNHTAKIAADEKCGVLQLAIDSGAAANEEIGIELGDGNGQLCQFSDTAGDDHLTAFECRVKVSSVTNGDLGLFIGLLGPGSVDGDTVADTTGVPNTSDVHLGFNIKADDGNSIDFYYEAASQTGVELLANCGVPTADTFVKLGFIIDPNEVPAKRLTIYVDNVEQSTYVTATQIATATFPDAEALTFGAGMKGIAGSKALELAIDWWAFAQVV